MLLLFYLLLFSLSLWILVEFSEEVKLYVYIPSTILLSYASEVKQQRFIHLGNPENFMAGIQICKLHLIWKWDTSELLKELSQNTFTKKENSSFFYCSQFVIYSLMKLWRLRTFISYGLFFWCQVKSFVSSLSL